MQGGLQQQLQSAGWVVEVLVPAAVLVAGQQTLMVELTVKKRVGLLQVPGLVVVLARLASMVG
ncbi:MAG: hypothetical protein HC767_04135 [Akkermansiaceae bacterium]|nr:hypothetical protein [Akkermansiaceae bacterium]